LNEPAELLDLKVAGSVTPGTAGEVDAVVIHEE